MVGECREVLDFVKLHEEVQGDGIVLRVDGTRLQCAIGLRERHADRRQAEQSALLLQYGGRHDSHLEPLIVLQPVKGAHVARPDLVPRMPDGQGYETLFFGRIQEHPHGVAQVHLLQIRPLRREEEGKIQNSDERLKADQKRGGQNHHLDRTDLQAFDQVGVTAQLAGGVDSCALMSQRGSSVMRLAISVAPRPRGVWPGTTSAIFIATCAVAVEPTVWRPRVTSSAMIMGRTEIGFVMALLPLAQVPIEYLRTGHEHYPGFSANGLENPAEILDSVGYPEDVGVAR